MQIISSVFRIRLRNQVNSAVNCWVKWCGYFGGLQAYCTKSFHQSAPQPVTTLVTIFQNLAKELKSYCINLHFLPKQYISIYLCASPNSSVVNCLFMSVVHWSTLLLVCLFKFEINLFIYKVQNCFYCIFPILLIPLWLCKVFLTYRWFKKKKQLFFTF